MAKRTTTKKAADTAPPETVIAFKGLHKDYACRGHKFEVGQSYSVGGKIAACSNGFHACEAPFDVWSYYPAHTSRFAVVALSGEMSRHDEDSKIAAASITIQAELSLPDFIRRGVAWLVEHARTNLATGDRGHAAATGDSGHAAATGDRGHAAVKGQNAIAFSGGRCATARADYGGWIVLADYEDSHPFNLIGVRAGQIGSDGLRPGVTYRLKGGEFVEAA